MLPWLAFEHMIPNLELTKLIAQKGYEISFLVEVIGVRGDVAMVGMGVTDEVKAREEHVEGKVAVDQGGDITRACFEEGKNEGKKSIFEMEK
ncbi:hypothetical protein VNO78_13781 [Psophocarpus tetragonolobus]|uniref:Uncharacterized protein n=1 Tax=Psophocarpus tetragonolobus TaxID=3891 RepID=A0AAN9SSI4_PSOTE